MSARTRKSLTLFWTALFVCSLLMQYANFAAAPPVAAVHNEGIFELDGNADDEATAGDDWEGGTPGALDTLFIPGTVEADGPDTTYFKEGGSKDHNDIPQWAWSATDVAPDKDELLDVFAAVYDAPDGTTVYFGADKFDDSGDAQIGFWFFQNAVGLNADGSFSGTHAIGDVLVLSDFTNGGSVDLICVYEWDGEDDVDIAPGVPTDTGCDLGDSVVLVAAGAECDVSGPDGAFDVCAIVNADIENAPWAFENKDGDTDFGVGQFFEGGINLDALFGGDAPCFSGFLAETRSSQEVEAQLKDFALGSLDTCRPPDIETQVSDSVIDVGESVTDTADLTSNDPTPTGSIEFWLCGPEASAPDCSTGGTLISTETLVGGMATSDPFTADSVDDAGFYCFRAEYTPDAAGELNYVAGSHTNLTTECFEVQAADIDVEKTADDATVNAGEQIGFTVTVSNTGSGTATGVDFTDDLPGGPGVSWSIESQSGTDFSITGTAPNQSLVFAPTTLAGGASSWVHIVSDTTAASCGVYDNTATVTTDNDGEDEASASTEVLCADVVIEKDADAASVNAGEQIGFTVTLTNNGDGDATGLTFTDALPGGPGISWSIESQSGGFSITGTAPNQDLVYSETTLDAGEVAWVHIVSDTTAASCGVYDNTASFTTGNDGSGEASASTEVLCADIEIEKDADAVTVNAGDQIGFTVTISNDGDGQATGLGFTDNLPGGPGISWSIESQSGGFSITGTAPNQSLVYSETTLDAGEVAWVHIVSDTTAASCGVYDNTATVTTGNDGSDEASDSTEVLCGEINVEKVADDDEVIAGNQIGFTVSLTNSGEGDLTGLSFTDNLPGGPGISWSIESSDAGWSITGTAPNQQLVYAPTTLDAGVTTSVHIVSDTTFDSCGVYNNTASVTTGNDGEDQASDSTSVRCPDIDLDKSHDDADGIVAKGQTVTYTLNVTVAEGPVTNAVVTDELPVGQTYVDGSQSSDPAETTFEVSADGRTLTWTYASLDNDGAVITYDVTIDEDAAIGDQVNVAEVCVSEVPECEGDDELVTVPDLTIVKSFTGNTGGELGGIPQAEIGDTLTYTLTYDLTNGPVHNGVITDVLPVGLAYITGSATNNAEFTFVDYDAATRTLTWTAPLVSADGSVTYQVTVLAAAADEPQPLINVATIDSDETPPDDDERRVLVAPPPLVLTPPPTLPPTDAIAEPSQGASNPGTSLMLVLLGLAGIALALGFVTPVPERVRRRDGR